MFTQKFTAKNSPSEQFLKDFESPNKKKLNGNWLTEQNSTLTT